MVPNDQEQASLMDGGPAIAAPPSTAKLFTRRDLIRGLPERWASQYAHYPRDRVFPYGGPTVGEIAAGLRALDTETCSRDDVRRAMGNGPDWTTHECDGCGCDVDVLVHIGEEADYEARWQDLCQDCLTGALSLFRDGEAAKREPSPHSLQPLPIRPKESPPPTRPEEPTIHTENDHAIR